jgi:hypothetical protein
MVHPLDGARLKVIRAQEHLGALQSEIGMYLHEKPYEFIREEHGDFLTFTPIISTQPPIRISTILGDCVTNCRAALDYILWALVQRYFDPPFDVRSYEDRKITAFPITDDPAHPGYLNRLKGLAKRQIPTPAIDEIRTVQPYNTGYKSLALLHDLVNTDKHRLPLLTMSRVHTQTIITNPDSAMRGLIRTTFPGGIKFQTRAVNVRSVAVPKDQVDMKAEATLVVTFQDLAMPRIPVDRALEEIIETVANVIPRFDRFF